MSEKHAHPRKTGGGAGGCTIFALVLAIVGGLTVATFSTGGLIVLLLLLIMVAWAVDRRWPRRQPPLVFVVGLLGVLIGVGELIIQLEIHRVGPAAIGACVVALTAALVLFRGAVRWLASIVSEVTTIAQEPPDREEHIARRATRGRFEVLTTDTRLRLQNRSAPLDWQRARAAPLIAFIAFPIALLFAGAEAVSVRPWIPFAVLGAAVIVVDLIWLFRRAIDEAPPFRCVQQNLVIEALPEVGGLRDAARRPALMVDGNPLDLDGAPRVEMTRSGPEGRGSRYRVSIVVGASVVRVDAVRDLAMASALADDLRAALGLGPPDVEPQAENLALPRSGLVIVALVELGGVAGATYWGGMMDCADRVGALVALAGVVAGAAFVIGRRVGLRIIQSVAMTSAQKTYGVQPVEPVRGRFGDRLLAASAGGVLLVVMIAGPQLTTAKLPRPMAPVAAAAARLEYERVRSEDGHRPMSGPATFALREAPGSPPELILSAAWSGKVVWTTELPARPVEGLPMAEAEGAGTVVVAATDLRTGGNLRLIGVDASSGRIRYVHRHPAKSNEPVYVVAAGSLVLVWSGQLAGVDPDSGRVTWITAGGE